jgi:hypothetical protein
VETKVAAVKRMASKVEKTEEGSREESWRDWRREETNSDD